MNIYRILYALLCIAGSITAMDQSGEKPPALENFRQTCYLNSTLQSLDNLQLLRNYLNVAYENLNHAHTPHRQLLFEVATARTCMHDPKYYNTFKLSCNAISRYMQEETGTGSTQQDATELIRKLTDQLETQYPGNTTLETLFRVSYDSEICDPHTNQRINTYCEHTTWPVQIGPFSDTNAPSQDTNLADLLQQYPFGTHTIEYTDQIGTHYDNAQKQDTITQLPQYLPIQITPRFFTQQEQLQQMAGGTPNGTLLNTTITIPQVLKFTKTNQAATQNENQSMCRALPLLSAQYSQEKGNVTYLLNSCIAYAGSGSSGHYWAHVRKGDTWYTCNDKTITQEDGFPQTWNPKRAVPYMVFYERIDSDQIPSLPTNNDDAPSPTQQAPASFWSKNSRALAFSGGAGITGGITAFIIYHLMKR